MNKIYSYKLHSISLISVIIFASGALNIPYTNYNGNSLVAFLAAAVIGIAAVASLALCVNIITSNFGGITSKIITVALGAALIFASVVSCVDAAVSFCRFVGDIMLPQTQKWFIFICFAAVMVVFAKSRESAILKFSLITAVLNATLILLLLLYCFKSLSFENLFENKIVINKDFFAQGFKCFCEIFLPAVTALSFIALSLGRVEPSCASIGAAAGGVILAICIAQCLMIFGETIAGATDYAYMASVGTVTTGSLFTRPDGFAYVMFFASYIIKASLGAKTTVMLIKKIIKKSRSV